MYQVKERIVWRRKQNLLVILDTLSGHYYTLNETAQHLWLGMFEGNKTLEQVVEDMRGAFNNYPKSDQIIADCQKIISEWTTNDLIQEL